MADAGDILYIIMVFFALGVGILILHNVGTTMFSSVKHSPLNESTAATTAITNADKVNAKLDMVLTTVFIGMCIAIMITGWLVGGHAIFMFIYFLVIVIGVILSTILANVWESIAVVPVLSVSVAALPVTNHILLFFPYYAAVVGTIGIIVMFGKPNVQY